MRFALAFLLLAHGLAHLVGFAVPWQLMKAPDLPKRTTIFGSAIDLGQQGMRAYGLLWLLMALVFVVAAGALAAQVPQWTVIAALAVTVSTVLCIASLPEAKVGLWLNVGLIVLLVIAGWRDWFSTAPLP
jgi:hypothetical protein